MLIELNWTHYCVSIAQQVTGGLPFEHMLQMKISRFLINHKYCVCMHASVRLCACVQCCNVL